MRHCSAVAEQSLYERVGGVGFFQTLVDRFYEGVAADPVLLALYPEPDDLAPARERLTLFLVQYWGGPTTYSDERGHPRLRMRHAPFAIGPDERDRMAAAHASGDRRHGRRRPRGRRRPPRLRDHGRRSHAKPPVVRRERRDTGPRSVSWAVFCPPNAMNAAKNRSQRNREPGEAQRSQAARKKGRRSAPPASGSTHCGAAATRSKASASEAGDEDTKLRQAAEPEQGARWRPGPRAPARCR